MQQTVHKPNGSWKRIIVRKEIKSYKNSEKENNYSQFQVFIKREVSILFSYDAGREEKY